MEKKKIGFLGAVLVVIVVAVVFWGMKSIPRIEAPIADKLDGTEEFGTIYYYGRECPHCVNVQKFIDENGISEKVLFTKKEVWHNADNAADLDLKVEECGLDKTKIGVPFLYAEGKCLVGEVEVRNFFKKAAGINQ